MALQKTVGDLRHWMDAVSLCIKGQWGRSHTGREEGKDEMKLHQIICYGRECISSSAIPMTKHESLKPEAELQLLSENNTVQINHWQNPDRCQGEWGAVRLDTRSDAPVTWEFCHNKPPHTPVLIGEWLTSSWETCPWACQRKQTTASVLQKLFQKHTLDGYRASGVFVYHVLQISLKG